MTIVSTVTGLGAPTTVLPTMLAKGNHGQQSKAAQQATSKAKRGVLGAPNIVSVPPKGAKPVVAKGAKGKVAAKPAKGKAVVTAKAPKAGKYSKWSKGKVASTARAGSNRAAWIAAILSVNTMAAAQKLTIKCNGATIAPINAGHVAWCHAQGIIVAS